MPLPLSLRRRDTERERVLSGPDFRRRISAVRAAICAARFSWENGSSGAAAAFAFTSATCGTRSTILSPISAILARLPSLILKTGRMFAGSRWMKSIFKNASSTFSPDASSCILASRWVGRKSPRSQAPNNFSNFDCGDSSNRATNRVLIASYLSLAGGCLTRSAT